MKGALLVRVQYYIGDPKKVPEFRELTLSKVLPTRSRQKPDTRMVQAWGSVGVSRFRV